MYHTAVLSVCWLYFYAKIKNTGMFSPLTSYCSLFVVPQVSPCLSVLSWLLFVNDTDILADACWALSYLSDGPNDKIQAVIDSGVCRRLVELLM